MGNLRVPLSEMCARIWGDTWKGQVPALISKREDSIMVDASTSVPKVSTNCLCLSGRLFKIGQWV